jgi:hypothetical protein
MEYLFENLKMQTLRDALKFETFALFKPTQHFMATYILVYAVLLSCRSTAALNRPLNDLYLYDE